MDFFKLYYLAFVLLIILSLSSVKPQQNATLQDSYDFECMKAGYSYPECQAMQNSHSSLRKIGSVSWPNSKESISK